MTSSARRSGTIKGIEVTEDSLSLETIRDTCLNGAGAFSWARSRRSTACKSEYVYPVDRRPLEPEGLGWSRGPGRPSSTAR